ncbi:hypothetical protein N7450_009043 [Penicillium hetheringtonii]|uniref:CRAL-TRIO domain-containing protein n=1 Tax=Penicillium hetheringtonii TaxID=911720 RepID=A0AAD6GQA2_9EURO|nr:hypothetical protein N7450_009043 [Penicillium hetheringtonii]
MTVPDLSTGYVGNLTPEQETKLRELWIILFTSISSVLSKIYDVPLPKGSPSKIFEVFEKIKEPTVDSILSALKGEDTVDTHQSNEKNTAEDAKHTNGATNGSSAPEETNGDGGNKEKQSLDKVDDLMSNGDAEKNVRKELASRKVTPEHFSVVFDQLRKSGVTDSEIKSMESILAKMTPEEMCFAILKMAKQENPDSLLLRFLRARKWDVDDDILPKGELYALEQSRNNKLSAKEKKEGNDFIAQLKTGKSFLHGFDRQGRPVNYVRVKIHKPGAQSEEVLERYIVHVIESTRLIVTPPVETGTIVFDMTGFGLSNMEYQPVKFIIKCFEANYPESLGQLLIHNAPWIFSGIWKLIHGWMDPVVASKVHFTKSVKDLDKYISRDQIPKELAGDENWEYKYVEPKEDENEIMKDKSAGDEILYERLMIGIKMLAATAAWISATTYAQGKQDANNVAELKDRRNKVIEEFRQNYWRLDPYIRARALIDRTGVLEPGGNVVGTPRAAKQNGSK